MTYQSPVNRTLEHDRGCVIKCMKKRVRLDTVAFLSYPVARQVCTVLRAIVPDEMDYNFFIDVS
jgi:hypothetical protein